MRLIRKEYVLVVVVSMFATIAVSTGCRTQRSMPKLADLAWWKKNDVAITSTPQPPASHFNPEPSAEMQSANAIERDYSGRIARLDEQRSVDNQESRTEIAERESKSPIRKPYSFDSGDARLANDNSFVATGAGELNAKLPDWNSSSNSDASKLSRSPSGFEHSSQSSNAASNFNPIADSAARSSSDFANSWRNDFALPSKTNSPAGENNIAPNIDRSIDPLVQTNNKVAGSMGSFEARFENAMNKAANSVSQSANEFNGNAIARSSQSLEPIQRNPNDWQSDTSKLSNQSPITSEGFPATPNQFSQSANQWLDQTDTLAPVSTQFSGNRPSARIAQAPLTSTHGSSNTGLPSNSLRPGNDQVMEPQRNLTTPLNENAYPTTPHGTYAPRNHVSQADAKASAFDAQASFESSVAEGKTANPAGFGIELPQSRSVPSPESTLVPEAIRHGNGSFAPGSINRLIPDSRQ